MKSIAAQELKANLDAILSSAQAERIVISRRGKPCAVLVGIEDYDADELGLANSDDFWRMIRARRAGGKSVSLSEVEAGLEHAGKKSPRKRASPRKSGNRS